MITKTQKKTAQHKRRHKRSRAKVTGTATRPRLAVFRSNRHIYAQLINDDSGSTIASADSRSMAKGKPVEKAHVVGKDIAELAKKEKIKEVVFDRGGFLYTGQTAAVADGAREAGLNF